MTLTFNETGPADRAARSPSTTPTAGRGLGVRPSSGETVTVDLPDAADLGRGTYVVGWYVRLRGRAPDLGVTQRSRWASRATRSPRRRHRRRPPGRHGGPGRDRRRDLPGPPRRRRAGRLRASLVLPVQYAGERVRSRIRHVVRIGGSVAATAGLLQVPRGVRRTHRAASSPTPRPRFDAGLVTNEIVSAVLLLLGLGGLARLTSDRPPEPERRVVLLAAAAARRRLARPSSATPAPTSRSRCSWSPTSVHLVAGAVWLGGLVGLVLTLRRWRAGSGLPPRTLARFSTLARGPAARGRGRRSRPRLADPRLLVRLRRHDVRRPPAGQDRPRRWSWRRSPPGTASGCCPGSVPRPGSPTAGARPRTSTRTVAAEALLLVGAAGRHRVPRQPVAAPRPRRGAARAAPASGRRARRPRVLAAHVPAGAWPQHGARAGPGRERRAGRAAAGTRGAGALGRPRPRRVPVTHTDAGTYRADVLLPSAGTWEVQVSLRQSASSRAR